MVCVCAFWWCWCSWDCVLMCVSLFMCGCVYVRPCQWTCLSLSLSLCICLNQCVCLKVRIDRLIVAWPFFDCGVMRLVNSVDERDPALLNRVKCDSSWITCQGLCVFYTTHDTPHTTHDTPHMTPTHDTDT